MSRPQTPQSYGGDGFNHRGQGRGQARGRGRGQGRGENRGRRERSRKPFQNHGQNRYHPTSVKANEQHPQESDQMVDWWDGQMKSVQPNEIQDRGDSRSSSPFSQSSQGPHHGRRGNNYRNRYQKGSSGSTQSDQKDKQPRYSKFNQLVTLSNKNGNSIVAEISDNSDFKLLLNSKMNKDFLVMTLRVLAQLKETNFTRIVMNILSDVCQSRFLEALEDYLVALTSDTRENIRPNRYYWEDVNKFWNNLHDFLEAIIHLVPVEVHDKLLPVMELIRGYVIQTIKNRKDHNVHENLLPRFQKLYHRLKEKTEKYAIAGNDMLKDFRTLNIVPTVEDLNDHHPYIRPCKIHGAYDSVDHYLDVQFRLLREDFICPLRAGIDEYKRSANTNARSSQISDIRVFEKVKLIGPSVVKNKIGITVFFGKMPKINWNRSKLFMYGSLLCLTNDQFKSVLFATVADRDSQLLEKGELIIEPCVGTQITRDMYNSDYVMVESKVYFLPYYHTLSSLRYMTEENFPMKRYVVDAESNPVPPRYLDRSKVYTYKGFEIPVMDERRWPSAKRLQLDDSQYEAFKCALLQELSVLHGPPGTGKTFMALQIASTLLANSSSWYSHAHPTPMIVVCLTNHALDQFLEGILSYTKSLVRIGEQSKNPNLSQYKLKAVREEYFKDENKKHRAWQRMTYYRRQVNRILGSLDKSYSALRALTSNTSIVSPNVLRQYCNDYKLQSLSPRDLLTNLFGAPRALLALGINTAPANSTQSVDEDDTSESEDEYVDADDDLDIASVTHTSLSEFTCLEIGFLNTYIQKCETEIAISQSNTDNKLSNESINELIEKLRLLQSLRDSLQTRLSHHPLLGNGSAQRNPLKDKDWEIYYQWLTSSYEVVKEQILALEEEFQEFSSQLNDFKQMTDLEVMRNSLVVGLTTTGAARLHESLRALQSPIVLVEEAAEILEAHVICSLTEHCQQVILIGDHKQLRPKPATYNLEINYNLNISLFERIVNMRDNCTQLVIQHRMRPQIAELISPSIYERLENHISVFTYPAVKGLEKNLFFINHQNHEVGSSDNESMSNPYEVKFLLAFAKYLIQQGYTPEEITILCTYSGQLFKFKEAKKGMQILRDVRVTTVDNYQGEENRIILLSLVRNNNTGNIGFLRIENRVCVALSRAREGLYMMGNMKNLVVKNDIWPKIKKALNNNDAIGDSLVLQCQIHNDQYTEIKSPADFKKLPNGGCSRRCDANLPCGHTCRKQCHISDRGHEDYVCKEPCLQKCLNGHPCKQLCRDACAPCQEEITVNLKCKHTVSVLCCTDLKEFKCAIKVPTILPCSHMVQKPCHRESSTYPCTHVCKKLLACGHSCVRKCHINDDPYHMEYKCKEDCTKVPLGCPLSHPCPKKCHEPCSTYCSNKILKERSCGHMHKVECVRNVENIVCTRRCNRHLPCGHACKLKCNVPCGPCDEMVEKTIPECGHEVKILCCEPPTTKICKGQCPRILKCGHPCTMKCCESCTEQCEYPRPMPNPALCKHVFPVPCYKIEAGLAAYADKLLQHCPTLCATLLSCGHTCSGSCGSCKQGRIHQSCREKCNKILICGHKCESLCKDPCRPCQKICSFKCEHNECKHKCGFSCTPCDEPCSLKCEHFKCSKLCGEICDRDFCTAPCANKLKCGHPCIGFCGELCPPLCRICDAKDLEVFVIDKNQSELRFVFLPECGHSIESNYLDGNWQKSYKVGIKVCPICKTRITQCTRYANQRKKERIKIDIVHLKVFQKLKYLREDQQKIINDITVIEREYAMHFPVLKAQKPFFASLRTLVNQRQTISAWQLKDVSSKLTIIGVVLHNLKKIPHFSRAVDTWPVVFNQVIMLMTSLTTTQNISHQMMDDVKNELSRLHYMVQLCIFESESKFKDKKAALQVEIIYLGLLNLRKFTKFRSDAMHKQFSNLKDSLKSSIPIEEWKQITVRLMGIEEEDWYKCSNGHIYTINCEQCQFSLPCAPIDQK